MDLRIERRKITELIPANYNPRISLKPGDPEFEKLRRSIEEFGYVDPVIWNERTGMVVGGHQRLSVLKELGITEVDVSVVDMDEKREKALNVALNKIEGGWHEPLLRDLLIELEQDNLLDLTGFDTDSLDELIDSVTDTEPGDAEEDEFDVDEYLGVERPTMSERGDVWLLGRHRLMCGDSTLPEDVSVLMDGKKAKMVFTDPPWNVNYGDVKEDNPQGYKPRKILNDFMGTEDFKEFMFAIFKNLKDFSELGTCTYVVMSAQEWGNMMLTLAQNGFHWSSTVIWAKDSFVMSRKDYHTQYEPIWYGWSEGAPRLNPLDDRKQSDVWQVDRPKKSDIHPTMKPVELVARAIENSSKPGWLVLDLFGGSGSTMMASEQTGRTNHSMELDPKYADAIVERYIAWKETKGADVFLLRNGERIPYDQIRKETDALVIEEGV